MKAVYISTRGDDTVELATPLEVEGYGVGVIEMNGRVQMVLKILFTCAVIFVKNLMLIILKCLF